MAMINAKMPKKIAHPVDVFKVEVASVKNTMAVIMSIIMAKTNAAYTIILGKKWTRMSHSMPSPTEMPKLMSNT